MRRILAATLLTLSLTAAVVPAAHANRDTNWPCAGCVKGQP